MKQLLVLAVVLAASPAFAQTSGVIPKDTAPRYVTLPGTCTIGQEAIQTGGTAGRYVCTAANTWTVLGSGGGGGTPAGSVGAIQFHDSGDVFGGFGSWDGTTATINALLATNAVHTYADTLATPAAPVIDQVGTTGSHNYGYRIVALRSDGFFSSDTSSEGTTATGHAVLTTGHYNTITTVVADGVDSYAIYRTSSDGTPSELGLIGSVAAGNAFHDTGAGTPALNSTDPTTLSGVSTGTSFSGSAAFAGAVQFNGRIQINQNFSDNGTDSIVIESQPDVWFTPTAMAESIWINASGQWANPNADIIAASAALAVVGLNQTINTSGTTMGELSNVTMLGGANYLSAFAGAVHLAGIVLDGSSNNFSAGSAAVGNVLLSGYSNIADATTMVVGNVFLVGANNYSAFDGASAFGVGLTTLAANQTWFGDSTNEVFLKSGAITACAMGQSAPVTLSVDDAGTIHLVKGSCS